MRTSRAIAAAALFGSFACQRAPSRADGRPDGQGAVQASGGAQAANAGAAPADKSGPAATLIVAGSIAGQLVPCGCSPDQLGGLPRGVALVKKLRAADPNLLVIDAGDLLFEAPPGETLRAQHELKARTLARGEVLLGASARAVGQRDLFRGAELAGQAALGVPLLDAGGLPVQGARDGIVLKAGAVAIGVLAGGLAANFEAGLPARVKLLREQGAQVVVLLFHPKAGGGPASVRALALQGTAKAAGVDLIVLGHRDDLATDKDLAEGGSPPILAAQGHFQSFLRLDLKLPGVAAAGAPVFLARGNAGKLEVLQRFDERIARLAEQAAAADNPERKKLYEGKIAEQRTARAAASSAVEAAPAGAIIATATFLPLDATTGEDAEAQSQVAAYDQAVAAMNLKAAQSQPEACPPADKGEPFFTGISTAAAGPDTKCATCHAAQTGFWQKTGHAHAWDTLVKVNKQLSLDCVRCHVTGWQQAGGVCRIDKTEVGGPGVVLAGRRSGLGRQDVQCEACHGPSSQHAADPPGHIKAQVTRLDCMRCHEAANSPHFDYDKYRPWVVGPGHGAPLAKGQQPGPVGPLGADGKPLQPPRTRPSEGKP